MWSITTSVAKLPRKRVDVGMILDVEQELHVPAEVLDALGKLARDVERQPGFGGAVDAEAAHAAVGQIVAASRSVMSSPISAMPRSAFGCALMASTMKRLSVP